MNLEEVERMREDVERMKEEGLPTEDEDGIPDEVFTEDEDEDEDDEEEDED